MVIHVTQDLEAALAEQAKHHGLSAQDIALRALRERFLVDTTSPEKIPEPLIDRARRLDVMGQTDAALDVIYRSIDQLLRSGRFSEIDSLLESIDADNYSTDIVLGLLTATLPARSKLTSRKQFFIKADRALRQRPEYEQLILTGLK